MQVSLTAGKHTVDLSADIAEGIASSLPDTKEYLEVLAALAEHPASGVRAQVAYKDSLPEETVHQQATDASPEVRRNIVRSSAGRKHLTEDMLRTLADADVDCAETTAGQIDEYVLHSTSLVETLAGCCATPRRLLNKLAKDTDATVRRYARYSLA